MPIMAGWKHASFSFASWYQPDRLHFGALRVLNDDIIQGGMGFGTHPHDNMEIVTIPLKGDLEHKDSMGNSAVIREGDIQVMSAGTGVQHSEYNNSPDKEINLFQLWLFPNKRNVTPRYDQLPIRSLHQKNEFFKSCLPLPMMRGFGFIKMHGCTCSMPIKANPLIMLYKALNMGCI